MIFDPMDNHRALMSALKFLGKKAGGTAIRAIENTVSKANIDPENEEKMSPIAEQLKSDNAHGFILGDKVAKDESEDGHIMIVGGVGSGKSSCLAIPSLLAWNERVFAIDIKGELYQATKNSAKRSNVKVFNPLDSNTIGYDPFYLLKSADNQVLEAQDIAHTLIPLPPNTPEPFWILSAQNLFIGAILHFYNIGYSFIDTVTRIVDTKVEELVDEICCSTTEDAARFVNSFVGEKTTTLSSILTTLSNHIMLFATDKNIKNSLSKEKNICPDDLESGADIYIRIPEDLLKQWKNLLTLMVSQFLTHFEKRPDRHSSPILFLLDEFARLGKMDGIVDGLATLRSKKITICIILQSLAQLDYHYGREARQIIADTCQYKAILNVTDVESQEYFSKAVGTYDKIRVTKTQQYDRFTHFKSGSSIATMTEEKPIIKPFEFATLKEIVLLTPDGAFKADKRPYYKDNGETEKTSYEEESNDKKMVEKLSEKDIKEIFTKGKMEYIDFLLKNDNARYLNPKAFKRLINETSKSSLESSIKDNLMKELYRIQTLYFH